MTEHTDINIPAEVLREALLERQDTISVDLLRQALSRERLNSYRRIRHLLLLIERSINADELTARYIEAAEAEEILRAEELKEQQNL